MVWGCCGNSLQAYATLRDNFKNGCQLIIELDQHGSCKVSRSSTLTQPLHSIDFSINQCFENKQEQQGVGLIKRHMHIKPNAFNWMVFVMSFSDDMQNIEEISTNVLGPIICCLQLEV